MTAKKPKTVDIGMLIKAAAAIILLCAAVAAGVISSDASVTAWTSRLVSFTGYGGAEYYKKAGYYVNVYGPDGTVAEVRYKAGGSRQRMYYLREDESGEEQSAYCIASGLSFSNGAEYGADTQTEGSFSGYFDNLPETARRGIAFASIYGYSSRKMDPYGSGPVEGTLGTDFWMATQCIIWEYQQGIRTDAGARKDNGLVKADDYYSMVRGKPAEKCYDYLLETIRNASALPGFGKGDESGWSEVTVLKETAPHTGIYYNNIYSKTEIKPGNYYVTDEEGNELSYITFSVNGNMFYLRSSREITDDLKVIVRRRDTNNTEGSAVFFSPGDSDRQTMLSTGGRLTDPYGIYLKLRTQDDTGTHIVFRMEKTSGDGKIEGVPFVITWTGRNQLYYNRIVYTDENGIAEAQLQIGVNAGDVLSDRRAVVVTEPFSEMYESNLTSYSGNITSVQVVYVYQLYQNESLVWGYSFNELFAKSLSYNGVYYRGHYYAIGQNYEDETAVLQYYNEPLYGSVRLTKTSETGVIGGFTFQLTGADTVNSDICLTAVTDASGVAVWNNVPPGNYYIREILPEDSIWSGGEPVFVTVTASETAETAFENILKAGTLKIIKTAEDDRFDGIGFVITSAATGETLSVEPDEDSVIVIDGKPTFVALIDGLRPGTYTVSEIAADRYVQTSSQTATVLSGTVSEVRFHNVLNIVSLRVVKQIYKSEFIPAHGDAVFIFKVTRLGSGDTYYRSLLFTAADKAATPDLFLTKEFSLSGLPSGTYVIEELKTLRYVTESVTASSAGFVIGGNGYLTLTPSSGNAWVQFVNKVSNQEKTSHTAYCENRFDYRGMT